MRRKIKAKHNELWGGFRLYFGNWQCSTIFHECKRVLYERQHIQCAHLIGCSSSQWKERVLRWTGLFIFGTFYTRLAEHRHRWGKSPNYQNITNCGRNRKKVQKLMIRWKSICPSISRRSFGILRLRNLQKALLLYQSWVVWLSTRAGAVCS